MWIVCNPNSTVSSPRCLQSCRVRRLFLLAATPISLSSSCWVRGGKLATAPVFELEGLHAYTLSHRWCTSPTGRNICLCCLVTAASRLRSPPHRSSASGFPSVSERRSDGVIYFQIAFNCWNHKTEGLTFWRGKNKNSLIKSRKRSKFH